ncbi:hypothetical protein ACHAWX_005641, partial [Stephanocyclus meneghinianus]
PVFVLFLYPDTCAPHNLYFENEFIPHVLQSLASLAFTLSTTRHLFALTMLAPLICSLLPCLLIGNILILSTLSAPEGRIPLYSIRCSSATPRKSALHPSLYGIRGGGFFGFGKRTQNSGSGGDDDGNTPKRFPALSQEEIEDKLNVPIFGITDLNGNGVILSDGGNHVFHFFFSKHMAEAASRAVAAANVGAPELKVSAFHLGKCWFRLIANSGSKMFKLQKCGNDSGSKTTKPIHFRLVPNMKGESIQHEIHSKLLEYFSSSRNHF